MSDLLCHDLSPEFPRLRAIGSTRELHASPAYREIGPRVRRLLETVVCYEHGRPGRISARPFHRAVAWNIERGLKLDGVIETLRTHPLLKDADLYFLTELDFGMARTSNRDVPGEIAERLGLNGVYAPCYLNLGKGSGFERQAGDENRFGIHGNALFSPWPIRDAGMAVLVNGKDKMKGEEKRIGSQRAVLATVELPGGPVRCASIHLDAHSSQGHRRRQLGMVLDALEARHAHARECPNAVARAVQRSKHPPQPPLSRGGEDVPPEMGSALSALVGGDWNTSTHNTSRAIWAIIGFWLRIAMGVERCLKRHYPYPDRLFERRLFRMVERRGYDYRSLNEAGVCTLRHLILDPAGRENLLDWVPPWCLDCIEWALRPFNNAADLKLDWFAGRGLRPAVGDGATPPKVVRDLLWNGARMSDHDPIVVDFGWRPGYSSRSA